MKNPDLSLFLPSLTAGGAPRIMINVGKYLHEKGYSVEFVLSEARGEFINDVGSMPIVDLDSRVIRSALPLRNYLRRKQPATLMSTTHAGNLAAIWATSLARTDTKHVVREPTTLSNQAKEFTKFKDRLIPPLVKFTYPRANNFIAISKGVKEELVNEIGVDKRKIKTIYNPIMSPEIKPKSKEPVDHPWFSESTPVVLAVGRLTKQKDFQTLIRSFRKLLDQQDAYLVILGEGPERNELENLTKRLNVDDRVELSGFASNPYKYMHRSDLFVLSSAWEGFGNVIVEAMACGTTVVSTDCESGPAEILADGRYGYLAPVGEPSSLHDQMVKGLNNPFDPETLVQRASEFSPSEIMPSYEEYLFS